MKQCSYEQAVNQHSDQDKIDIQMIICCGSRHAKVPIDIHTEATMMEGTTLEQTGGT